MVGKRTHLEHHPGVLGAPRKEHDAHPRVAREHGGVRGVVLIVVNVHKVHPDGQVVLHKLFDVRLLFPHRGKYDKLGGRLAGVPACVRTNTHARERTVCGGVRLAEAATDAAAIGAEAALDTCPST